MGLRVVANLGFYFKGKGQVGLVVWAVEGDNLVWAEDHLGLGKACQVRGFGVWVSEMGLGRFGLGRLGIEPKFKILNETTIEQKDI